MSEQDFRDAIHKTMDAVTAPPPMSDAPVLEAAHRDQRRRRTLWASVGTAAVVAVIAVGVVLVAPTKQGGDGVQVGGQPSGPQPTEDVATPQAPSGKETTGSGGTDTEETLPPGMTDRTQRSGAEYERGVALAAELDEVMAAAGYGTPGDLEGTGDLAGSLLKRDQANYDGKIDGVERWTYTAITPVTKGDSVGEVFVDVVKTVDEAYGCDRAARGQCEEIEVDGKKVAFVDVDDAVHEHVDQYAVYRHDDGTLVSVSQSLDFGFTDLPALSALPFTPEQLAALAVDPRFKVAE